MDGTLTVRGCTTSSSRSVHSISRRTRPERVGADGAHRSDGDDASAQGRDREVLGLDAAFRRLGRASSTTPSPTGTSSTDPRMRRGPAFCTLDRAAAPTPRRRPCGAGARAHPVAARARSSTSAATRASASDAQPATTSSTQPSRYPKPSADGMRASTTQPIGVMTPLSRRPHAREDAADRADRAHGADDRVGEDAGARADEPGPRVGEPGRIRLRRRIGATRATRCCCASSHGLPIARRRGLQQQLAR